MKYTQSWFSRAVNEKQKLPRFYRFSYHEFEKADTVFYPIGINIIVRYSRLNYWGILRLLHRFGIIDTAINECFRWADFYRIKSH